MEVNIKINDHPTNFVIQNILNLILSLTSFFFYQNNMKVEPGVGFRSNLKGHVM
jgi:hypothetical protein